MWNRNRHSACVRAGSAAVRASRRVVDDAVARGVVVYGVTTGFGSFADVHVPLDREVGEREVRGHQHVGLSRAPHS